MVKKNITREEIAREAGVSVSVVSRALNNSGYVNKEKKEKILEIADRVDIYRILLQWPYSTIKPISSCSFATI